MAKLDVDGAMEFFSALRDKDALLAECETRLVALDGEIAMKESRVRELDEACGGADRTEPPDGPAHVRRRLVRPLVAVPAFLQQRWQEQR